MTTANQLSQPEKILFSKEDGTSFYEVLRARVNSYFADRNLSKHANGAMILKSAIIIAGFFVSYTLLLSGLFAPWALLLLAMANGFFIALIGLNIAHDGVHGAYSSNKTVNHLMGLWFNIVGANDYIWNIKHNIVHHTFTNIPDHDDDIDQLSILRINPNQKRMWVHRFQHLYIFLLYPLSTLSWVFIKDYKNFFRSNFGWYDNSKYPRTELFRLFLYKAFYYAMFLAVPMLVIDLPWYYILYGFVALHFVEGLALSVIFQLAHVVEGTGFPEPDNKGAMSQPWAVHQMHTTADFACGSRVINYLFGGLNFQIEHHLFPKICHIHYPKLAPIVRQTAGEFGLPYIENRTFFGAIGSHMRALRRLGA